MDTKKTLIVGGVALAGVVGGLVYYFYNNSQEGAVVGSAKAK